MSLAAPLGIVNVGPGFEGEFSGVLEPPQMVFRSAAVPLAD